MTIFYDPHKRKPKMLVIFAVILIPLLLVTIIFIATRKAVSTKRTETKTEQNRDIFKEIDKL
ncbi:MAG: hypothetical protein K8S27_16725 [Candidatus Omnitrophica bacterium]|nr:hypothetical protein [Candidatus Omnitrophota bacterium]